jgi:hypothetical protein
MIKNTAGQRVGVQMVSAADGSAFTGAVTVAVTVDAGTQATGSVGSGACAHEGNGYHTYAPAQAETSGDLLAFTFTGAGAIPTTVQIYTVTGDAFARLGAPAGASIAADLLAIDNLVDDLEARVGTPSNLGGGATLAANLADIEAQTDDIGVAGAGLTALASAANLATVAGYLDTEVAAILAAVDTEVSAIKAKTDQLAFTTANQVDARVLTNSDKTGYAIGTGGIGAAAFASGAIDAAALNADAIDEILDEPIGDSTITMRQALKLMVAALSGKVSGAGTGTITFRNAGDTVDVMVASVSGGNRTAVTRTL